MENQLSFEDNRFRPLTYMKVVAGICATIAGMSLGQNITAVSLLLSALWVGLVVVRNILVDMKAFGYVNNALVCRPQKSNELSLQKGIAPAGTRLRRIVEPYSNVRRKKLANDIFVSGLSSIPMLQQKSISPIHLQ